MRVEVAYAEPARAVIQAYEVASSSRVADVLSLAAADPAFQGIELARCRCGIFGRLATPEQALCAGDRIEIYRPLAVDPKVARRTRARDAHRRSL